VGVSVGGQRGGVNTSGEHDEITLCGGCPQGGKGSTARFRSGRAQPPLAQPDHVQGHRGDEMLQVGFSQPEVPGLAEAAPPDGLCVPSTPACRAY
jgi:hypothetical protein